METLICKIKKIFQNINMSKNIVITGATGILGRATAKAVSSENTNVHLIVHNKKSGDSLLETIKNINPKGDHKIYIGELSDPGSIHDVAAQIAKNSKKVHALIHTAAYLSQKLSENKSGHELMFSINVIARIY